MSDQREQYLEALGIPVWKLRAPPATPATNAQPVDTAAPLEVVAMRLVAGSATAPAAMGWDELAAAVSVCTKCALHATRTQTVFGVGRRNADLLVIGEAPGADEDRQGEPFADG